MGDVEYTVRSHATWQIPMDVTGAPDTSNSQAPSAGTVRPIGVAMSLMPNSQTGAWEVTSATVVGPKVKNDKVSTKRDYGIVFMDPLYEDSVAPEWLRDICQDWVNKANGSSSGGFKDIDEALEQARVPDAFPDYDVKGAVARVAQRVEKGLTIEPASYSFQARPVDVGAGTPGDLYVNVLGKLHSLGSLGRAGFSVQYYLGTTIDFEWDTDLGELVIDTPGNFLQPVISASADGKLAVRIEGKRKKGA
jgi:hypothetical protein